MRVRVRKLAGNLLLVKKQGQRRKFMSTELESADGEVAEGPSLEKSDHCNIYMILTGFTACTGPSGLVVFAHKCKLFSCVSVKRNFGNKSSV